MRQRATLTSKEVLHPVATATNSGATTCASRTSIRDPSDRSKPSLIALAFNTFRSFRSVTVVTALPVPILGFRPPPAKVLRARDSLPLPVGLLVEERLGALFPNCSLHSMRYSIKVFLEEPDVCVNFAVAETSPMYGLRTTTTRAPFMSMSKSKTPIVPPSATAPPICESPLQLRLAATPNLPTCPNERRRVSRERQTNGYRVATTNDAQPVLIGRERRFSSATGDIAIRRPATLRHVLRHVPFPRFRVMPRRCGTDLRVAFPQRRGWVSANRADARIFLQIRHRLSLSPAAVPCPILPADRQIPDSPAASATPHPARIRRLSTAFPRRSPPKPSFSKTRGKHRTRPLCDAATDAIPRIGVFLMAHAAVRPHAHQLDDSTVPFRELSPASFRPCQRWPGIPSGHPQRQRRSRAAALHGDGGGIPGTPRRDRR